LGLVGLIALMVGGIGVASSIRAFLKEKLETIAVLKALGAESGTILRVYLSQTVLLGVLGSLAGAALGAAFQVALPPLLKAWLPIELEFRLALLPFVRGMGMGGRAAGQGSISLAATSEPPAPPGRARGTVEDGASWRTGGGRVQTGASEPIRRGARAPAPSSLEAGAGQSVPSWEPGPDRSGLGGSRCDGHLGDSPRGAEHLVGDRRERAHRRADVLLHRHPAGSARRVRALARGARPYRRA